MQDGLEAGEVRCLPPTSLPALSFQRKAMTEPIGPIGAVWLLPCICSDASRSICRLPSGNTHITSPVCGKVFISRLPYCYRERKTHTGHCLQQPAPPRSRTRYGCFGRSDEAAIAPE